MLKQAYARISANVPSDDVPKQVRDELNEVMLLANVLATRGWQLASTTDRTMVWQRTGRNGVAVIRMSLHGFVLAAEQVFEPFAVHRTMTLRRSDITRHGRRLTRLERLPQNRPMATRRAR